MKKLFFKLSLLSSLLFIPTFFIVWKNTRFFVDEFYFRFLFTKSDNLVLGSSRSAQAINPEMAFQKYGINFSFTHSISPYGEVYSNAIRNVCSDNDGVVYIEVNPMMLSEDCEFSDNPEKFRERNLMLNKVKFYGLNPNLDYLFTSYKSPLYGIMLIHDEEIKNYKLHSNGWLEVFVKGKSNYIHKSKRTIQLFKGYFSRFCIAQERIESLSNLIVFLKESNKTVMMVRLPISSEVLNIENGYWNDFNAVMMKVANSNSVQYYDFSKDMEYETHDGSHLTNVSAIKFSKMLKGLTIKQ